jgi:hypothetical protein
MIRILAGRFSLEIDDLLFAVLCIIELGSLVYIFHSVAQNAVDKPRRVWRPWPWPPPEVLA